MRENDLNYSGIAVETVFFLPLIFALGLPTKANITKVQNFARWVFVTFSGWNSTFQENGRPTQATRKTAKSSNGPRQRQHKTNKGKSESYFFVKIWPIYLGWKYFIVWCSGYEGREGRNSGIHYIFEETRPIRQNWSKNAHRCSTSRPTRLNIWFL